MKIHTRRVPAPHRAGVPAALLAFLLLAAPCAVGTDHNPGPEPYPPEENPPPAGPCGPCESDCDSGSCGGESSCSEAGSVFFSLDLGRVRFDRKTDLFRNAIVAGHNPVLSSAAHRNRDFRSLNEFYRKSPLTGMRQFKLWIAGEKMTWPIYYRSAIKLDQETTAETISDVYGIRQILTHDRFVDIQSLADVLDELEELSEDIHDLIPLYLPEGYVIRTWQAGTQGAKSGTYYPLPGSAPLSWTIVYNPDEWPAEHRLAIIHMKVFNDSLAYKTVSHLHEDVRDPYGDPEGEPVRWTLETFDGLPTGNPVETVDIEYDTYVNERKFTRVRTVSRAALDAGGNLGGLGVIHKVLEEYDAVGSLSRLVRKIDAYDTDAERETLYGWHDTPSDTYVHGLPRYVIHPDGSYEHHTYSFNVAGKTGTVTRRTPWKNNTWTPSGTPPADSTCVKELTTFETPNKIVTVRSIDTQTIARTTEEWATESGDLVFIETQGYDAANDLVTKTGYYPSTASAHLANRIKWRELPDGTAETYEYTAPVSGLYLQTVKRGAGSRSAITAGTMVKSTRNTHGVTVIEETDEFGTFGTLRMEDWIATGVESVFGRVTFRKWNGNDHDYEETEYACCGISSHRDRRGVETSYHRDSLKRTWKTVRTEGTDIIATTTAHTYGTDCTITETRRNDGETNLLVSKTWRHINGETSEVRHPDQDGDSNPEPTTYSYSYLPAADPPDPDPSAGRVVTVTHPDGGTEISTYLVDGRIASRTGTAVNNTEYDYGYHTTNGGGLWSRTIALDENNDPIAETVTSFHDPAGRLFRTEFNSQIANGSANDAVTHSYFAHTAAAGSRGQRSSTTDPDGVTTSFTYDSQGRLYDTIEAMPLASPTNRVTRREYSADDVSGVGNARITTTKVNNVEISQDIRAGHGYASRSIQNQSRVTTTLRSAPSNADAHTWHETITHPDGTHTRNYFVEGRLVATTRWKSGSTPAAGVPAEITSVGTPGFIEGQAYSHDAFGRVLTSTDSRTGTTQYTAYTESGNLLTRIDPGGIVPAGRTTTYEYDNMGRQIKIDAPNTAHNNITHTSYTLKGEVRAVWGDQTNPTFRVYDEQGRLLELHTWQDAPTLAHTTDEPPEDSALTAWQYHPSRGFLVRKEYDDENGTTYTHTAAGRIETRTWQRGVVTEYGYQHGMLKTVGYSGESNGHTTADITYGYDAYGRIATISRDGATWIYGYDGVTLQLESETHPVFGGDFERVITRHPDAILRPGGYEIGTAGDPDLEGAVAYDYDDEGRLEDVSSGGMVFTYDYVPESGNLIHTVTGPADMLVTNTWFPDRDVLEVKKNEVDSSTVSQFTYGVNDIGQRDGVATAGSAFGNANRGWTWGYDALGQVTSAVNAADTGLNRAYAYDAIGNRTSATDGTGGTAVTTGYTPNSLNQYETIDPGDPVSPVHDLDGNLTEDMAVNQDSEDRQYVWDAENRLVAVNKVDSRNGSGEITGTTLLASYEYDPLGRRIRTTTTSAANQDETDIAYLYDGWNVVIEYRVEMVSDLFESGEVPELMVDTRNVWGLDLSGSLQGAGGVGGLLATGIFHGSNQGYYFPTYDGNGNISEYLDAAGDEAVHFEYDPFGRLADEPNEQIAGISEVLTYRFSTKPIAYESGLYYYLYRYYDPVTGRWPSRDPIGERGGFNLYGFVQNMVLDWIDVLGGSPLASPYVASTLVGDKSAYDYGTTEEKREDPHPAIDVNEDLECDESERLVVARGPLSPDDIDNDTTPGIIIHRIDRIWNDLTGDGEEDAVDTAIAAQWNRPCGGGWKITDVALIKIPSDGSRRVVLTDDDESVELTIESRVALWNFFDEDIQAKTQIKVCCKCVNGNEWFGN
jgi:RHS repeat-associated protein